MTTFTARHGTRKPTRCGAGGRSGSGCGGTLFAVTRARGGSLFAVCARAFCALPVSFTVWTSMPVGADADDNHAFGDDCTTR